MIHGKQKMTYNAIRPVLSCLCSSGMKNIIPAANSVHAMLGNVARSNDLRPTEFVSKKWQKDHY
jgi:hypothetical protein